MRDDCFKGESLTALPKGQCSLRLRRVRIKFYIQTSPMSTSEYTYLRGRNSNGLGFLGFVLTAPIYAQVQLVKLI